MRIRPLILLGLAGMAVAACEGTDIERGALGAGVGAASAAALDGNIAAGAAVGGAAGIVCDDLTPNLCN